MKTYYMPDCIFNIIETHESEDIIEHKIFFSKVKNKQYVVEALKRKGFNAVTVEPFHPSSHPAPITALWRVLTAKP